MCANNFGFLLQATVRRGDYLRLQQVRVNIRTLANVDAQLPQQNRHLEINPSTLDLILF